MAIDDLATQEAKSSAAIALVYLSRNIPVFAREGLNAAHGLPQPKGNTSKTFCNYKNWPYNPENEISQKVTFT